MTTLYMVSAQWGTGPRRWLPPGVVMTEPRAEVQHIHTSQASARAAWAEQFHAATGDWRLRAHQLQALWEARFSTREQAMAAVDAYRAFWGDTRAGFHLYTLTPHGGYVYAGPLG